MSDSSMLAFNLLSSLKQCDPFRSNNVMDQRSNALYSDDESEDDDEKLQPYPTHESSGKSREVVGIKRKKKGNDEDRVKRW